MRNGSRFLPVSFTHPISSKLDQNNFLVWRKQVLATIRGHRRQNFLFGSIPPPKKYVAAGDEILGHLNPDYLDWKQQDQLILSWLLASMSNVILPHVVNCDTSAQIESLLLAQEVCIDKNMKSLELAFANLAQSGYGSHNFSTRYGYHGGRYSWIGGRGQGARGNTSASENPRCQLCDRIGHEV